MRKNTAEKPPVTPEHAYRISILDIGESLSMEITMQTNTEEQLAAVLALIEQAGYPPLLTTHEAAAFLRLKQAAVLRALAAGTIQGVRVGGRHGRWRISRDEVARYAIGACAK